MIIEDDPKTAQALATCLTEEGFGVSISSTGEEGFYRLSAEAFDLVLLDWMLPARDGLEILKTLRTQRRQIPVLLLTARDSVADRVRGLECGADDYVVKPFAIAEVVAALNPCSAGPQPRNHCAKRWRTWWWIWRRGESHGQAKPLMSRRPRA